MNEGVAQMAGYPQEAEAPHKTICENRIYSYRACVTPPCVPKLGGTRRADVAFARRLPCCGMYLSLRTKPTMRLDPKISSRKTHQYHSSI